MANKEIEPPVGDIEWIKDLAKTYRENPGMDIGHVFSMSLLGYYDAMWGGLDRNAGHIIYRLSDHIPQEEREKISIYPSETGSIVMDAFGPWDSLEDWRKQWKEGIEKSGETIPILQPQLQEGIQELANVLTPIPKELNSTEISQ